MKKFLFAIVLLFSIQGLAQETTPEPTPEVEPRAVQVRFFGGFTGFDQGAYRAIKSSIASLIVEGLVVQYKTTEIGMEGGSEFCVELSNNPNHKIESILQILQTIKPSDVSVYSYQAKLNCQ